MKEFVIEIQAKATVKSFAPSMFVKLRNSQGIQEADLISSLDPVNNREQIFKSNQHTSAGTSSNEGGSSGSFFFFTQDKKFIVKTISKAERLSLLKLLPALHKFSKD